MKDHLRQAWQSVEHEGIVYSFEHLNAKTYEYLNIDKSKKYIVYVTVSHHVFTVSSKKATESHITRYPHCPEDERIFCMERYNMSFSLPRILENLPNEYCYHGGHKRFCVCEAKDEKEFIIHYQVVFRVWRYQKRLRLHVESAYPLLGRPSGKKKVNFLVICHNAEVGKELPSPSVR
jgi:hypothetical protein